MIVIRRLTCFDYPKLKKLVSYLCNDDNDKMTKNTLMFAKRVFGTYIADENAGAAIVFGDDYKSVEWGNLVFSYNSIGMNEVWDAEICLARENTSL